MSFFFSAHLRTDSRRPLWPMLLAGLLIIPTGSAVCQSPPAHESVIQQHYDMAQTMQAADNLPEAARQYRLFIADALGEMALQTANLAQYAKAAPLFAESLRLAPNSPGLKVRFAQAALAAHDFPKAKALTEDVLRDYPANVKAVTKAHLLLGWALLRMDQEAAARQHFEAAVALDPNFENGYALAIACLDLGDGSCAAKVFSEMVAGLGDTAVLHMEIGRAYLNSDFQQEAVPEFKKAIAIDKNLAGAHYSLAVSYLTLGGEGSGAAAQSELMAELKLSPDDAPTYVQLGNLAFHNHDYATADRELKQAIALDAKSSEAFFYLGQLYQETSRDNEAMAAYRQSISLTKDPAYNRYQVQKVHYLLGHLLIRLGKTEEGSQELQASSALLNRSLKRDRDRLAGYLYDATSPVAGGDVQAIATGATADGSNDLGSHELGDYEKRLAPALADSYNNLGVIAAGEYAFDNALTAFAQAYHWNPQLDGLDANWGRAAFRFGRYSVAIPVLARQLQVNPGDLTVLSELATSLFKMNDYAGVVKILREVPNKLESMPELACILGTSLVKTGKDDAGLKLLLQIEAVHPDMAEVHTSLGEAYREVKDFTHAASEFSSSITTDPRDPSGYRSLGVVQLEQGNLTGAIHNLETASKLDPQDLVSHRYLALAYRKGLRNRDADREQAICEALDKSRRTPGSPSSN